MVLMPLLRSLVLFSLAFLPACHLEDHTPLGTRRDEAQIREVIVEYYRGLAEHDWATIRKFFAPDGRVSYPVSRGDSGSTSVTLPPDSVFLDWARMLSDRPGRALAGEAQVLRTDLRQVDGVAAAWVTSRLDFPYPMEQEDEGEPTEHVDHVVLHRTPEGWRIVLLSLAVSSP
jgi:SnoaL-like domain